MHQAAFPGEDISDRPLPESVAPALVRLVTERLPSGRYRAAELVPAVTAIAGAGARPRRRRAEFTLPPELEAHAPPEARGLPRDGVRMLVSRAASGAVAHHRFTDLPGAAPARRPPGGQHVTDAARRGARRPRPGGALLTARPDGSWLVEPRIPAGKSSLPSGDACAFPRSSRCPAGRS